MKEEKILIGERDGYIAQLVMYRKLQHINNFTIPTLTALGLSGDIETVIDIAAGGFEKLKEVYIDRYYAAHPETERGGDFKDFVETGIVSKLQTVCERYKFSGLPRTEADGTAGLKKLCKFNAAGLLEIDDAKFEESQKVYATGDNAKLYREIIKAVKCLNEACRGYLPASVFGHLFYFSQDNQLRIKGNIDSRVLDEIRGEGRGSLFI